MTHQLIYSTYSRYEALKLALLRLILFVIILFAAWYFRSNPLISTLVIVLCCILILGFGNDRINVYHDHFTYEEGSLLKRLEGKQEFHFSELESVSCDEPVGELAPVFLVKFFIRNDSKTGHQLFVKEKEGKEQTIHTRITPQKIHKVTEMINSRITQ